MKRRAWLGLVVLAAAVLLVTCGPTTNQRAVKAALLSVNVARDGFVVWDRLHQAKIVQNATELVQARRDLAAYRAQRESVVLAFEAVYKALATAAIDPGDEPVRKALEAVKAMDTALHGLGVPARGPPH